MSYPFIDLTKANKNELVAHLREQCGIEKDGKKEDLVQAILDFETANGLVRHQSGITAESPTTPTDLPLSAYKRVRMVIAPSETDSSDVYVSIGDWDALIKRGEEVAIPEPAYQLLAKSGEVRYDQNTDGSLREYFAPRFSITVLGEA